MNRSLALAASLAASLAAAESYTVVGSALIDLPTMQLTSSADAELKLEPLVIKATYGIRIEDGNQQFSSAVPIVLKTAYRVKDAQGAEYRFWVHAVERDSRWIEVLPAAAPAIGSSNGVFRETAFLVDGTPSRALSRKLRLNDDGTYDLNGESGRFAALDRNLVLEGQPSLRSGELSRDGSQVSFRYQRNGIVFTVVMTRETTVASR